MPIDEVKLTEVGRFVPGSIDFYSAQTLQQKRGAQTLRHFLVVLDHRHTVDTHDG